MRRPYDERTSKAELAEKNHWTERHPDKCECVYCLFQEKLSRERLERNEKAKKEHDAKVRQRRRGIMACGKKLAKESACSGQPENGKWPTMCLECKRFVP